MQFKTFLEQSGHDEDRKLWIYRCPFCGSDAYNGDPVKGGHFRGSAECSKCKKSFSVIGMKPISQEGPLYVEPDWGI